MILRLAIIAALYAGPAFAEAPEGFDFSFKVGNTSGNLTFTKAETETKTELAYGGIPFVVGYTHDISRAFSLHTDLNIVVDPTNVQMNKFGLTGGLAWHMIGGSRRNRSDLGAIVITSREPYNFSLLLKRGLHRYNTNLLNDPNSRVEGFTLEIEGGFTFRYDLSEKNAVGLEATYTLVDLSASTDRIGIQRSEVLLFWRLFL